MELGTRIASWRKAKGWTQRKLAEAVDVTVSAVCLWEGAGKNKVSPSQDHLEAVVAALGLTMAKFYGRVPKVRAKAA